MSSCGEVRKGLLAGKNGRCDGPDGRGSEAEGPGWQWRGGGERIDTPPSYSAFSNLLSAHSLHPSCIQKSHFLLGPPLTPAHHPAPPSFCAYSYCHKSLAPFSFKVNTDFSLHEQAISVSKKGTIAHTFLPSLTALKTWLRLFPCPRNYHFFCKP